MHGHPSSELPRHTVIVDAEVFAAISAMPDRRRACGRVCAGANGEVQFAIQVPEPVLTALTADRARPDDSYNEVLPRFFPARCAAVALAFTRFIAISSRYRNAVCLILV